MRMGMHAPGQACMRMGSHDETGEGRVNDVHEVRDQRDWEEDDEEDPIQAVVRLLDLPRGVGQQSVGSSQSAAVGSSSNRQQPVGSSQLAAVGSS